MKHKDFAVFILSYARPDKIKTIKTLLRQGYTGKIFIVVGDDDPQLEDYKNKYDNLLIFNKDSVNKGDTADNFTEKRCIFFARNACFDLARQNDITNFIMLDDDYVQFRYTHDTELNYITKRKEIKNLDNMFDIFLDFYISTNIKSIAFAQGGDFIGGDSCYIFGKKIIRKCMNSFFCSTEREFDFFGRVNEDVCTYVYLGSLGEVFFTVAFCRLEQTDTQQSTGGMTEMYQNKGTYIKSFYPVLFCPSAVKISTLGYKKRFHHVISWNNAVPKILKP